MSFPAWTGNFLALVVFIFVACGDETTEITQINQAGIEVISSVGDLPECSKDNEGEQALVKGETSVRVCVDGEWFATESVVDTLILAGDTVYMQGGKDTVYVNDAKFSCTTQELADSSGLKIVCNGDSIGVVLNGVAGKDGTPGQTGAGCTLKDRTDTTVTVACGDSTMVIEVGRTTNVSSEDDTATISLEAIEGYTQKGPFLKGSTVYLYELNGSLGQTNGNFTSVITSDDGRYRFRTRGLKYPYAMVVVDGYYRNEVTGERSDAPIRLRAITDVSGRVTGSANVNLLTHLEYERANKLATGPGKLKLKEAKHKAQKEILDAFHFDTNLVKNVQSEDMDVFGKGDADAALLAISILLQGDGTSSDLSVLLTEISDDMAEDGEWDSTGSAETRVRLAEWALVADSATQDSANKLFKYRDNVKGWGLGSGDVPYFEKFVRMFYGAEMGLGVCGRDSILEGMVKQVKNPLSSMSKSEFLDRYVCADAQTGHWVRATVYERDTYGNVCNTDNVGEIKDGNVQASNKYYCAASGWISMTAGWSWEIPLEARLNSKIDYGSFVDERDNQVYKTVQIGNQVWMAQNLNYADSTSTESLVGNSWCAENNAEYCKIAGRLYTWAAAIDSVKLENDLDNPVVCGYGKTCTLPEKVQGICPEGWHLPSEAEWGELLGLEELANILKSTTGWADYEGRSGNGSDGVGFSILPVGYKGENYSHDGITFYGVGGMAAFWSKDLTGNNASYSAYSPVIGSSGHSSSGHTKDRGLSVRCVMDNPAAP